MATKKRSTDVTTRVTAIDAWLEKVHARHQATFKSARMAGALDVYTVGGKVVVLQTYANGHGWDVFIPACDTNSVDATIAALDTWAKDLDTLPI